MIYDNLAYINPAIIEYNKFKFYQDKIPLLGGVRGGFLRKIVNFKIINYGRYVNTFKVI